MIEKILKGFIEKLYNLIPNEIREFVQYSLEPEDGTTNNYFISLSINTNKPKQYKIEIDDEEIKITDVSVEKAKNISEDELIKELETIAKKYQKLCNKAEIPMINPATKKLLEAAKRIRNKAPEGIRWGMKTNIQKNGYVVLTFPMDRSQIQTGNYNGKCILWFTGNSMFLEASYREKGNIDLHGEIKENEKTFSRFLKTLV